jgi:hypothetical protein
MHCSSQELSKDLVPSCLDEATFRLNQSVRLNRRIHRQLLAERRTAFYRFPLELMTWHGNPARDTVTDQMAGSPTASRQNW